MVMVDIGSARDSAQALPLGEPVCICTMVSSTCWPHWEINLCRLSLADYGTLCLMLSPILHFYCATPFVDKRLFFLYLLPPPKKEVMFLVRSVCLSVCLSICLSVFLSVCPSDYSQTCERILTKFSVGVGHGSRTKWYNFGGDPDHASDPGVQSPKSGSSGLPCSAEVCSL